jgi:hypothetical protein
MHVLGEPGWPATLAKPVHSTPLCLPGCFAGATSSNDSDTSSGPYALRSHIK